MKPPVLHDWKRKLEERVESELQTKEGLTEIIHLCEELLEEIEPVTKFLNEQRIFVVNLKELYQKMYDTRFHELPPPRPKKDRGEEVLLDTPEIRKQAVREMALAVTSIGGEITDEDVLKALESESKHLVADNPTATISTILNGYKSHFEKVEGKRGVFKRK